MNDERLGELLRGALPPVGHDERSPDLWARLAVRVEQPPRWSLLDLGLAAAVGVVLLLNPEWIWLLAYHL